MAAKRDFPWFRDESDESDYDSDRCNEKRIKTTRPSLVSCIRTAVMVNTLHEALEPLLRKVVYDEVSRRVTRPLTKSPSLRIQAPRPSTLKLVFRKGPSLPIFTGTKLLDPDNCQLQLLLIDAAAASPPRFSPPIRAEIVPLYGDFSQGEDAAWTVENFNKSVAREREGKRPLLAGELTVTVRDGVGSVGDVEFTDNSSWVRCRKFRVGARVAPGSGPTGVRILEAVTEAFVVRDHRGESSMKHRPPNLEDEVWRLKKIGKDGPFHQKLRSEGINTVQDFLKLFMVDSCRLKMILRNSGMADKMLEAVTTHAKECKILGNKYYIYRGSSYWVVLNPICQVVQLRNMMDGQIYSGPALEAISCHAFVEKLAREAYENWNALEEIEGLLEETPLLPKGNVVDITGYTDVGCSYWTDCEY